MAKPMGTKRDDRLAAADADLQRHGHRARSLSSTYCCLSNRIGGAEVGRTATLTEYIRSMVGAQFKQSGKYALLYVWRPKGEARLALPVDFKSGDAETFCRTGR